MKEKQIVVGEYENEIDAEIAKRHLELSGIPQCLKVVGRVRWSSLCSLAKNKLRK